MKLFAATALVMALAAVEAHAQSATPEQIAAAKAEADKVIAASGAARWFVNATVDNLPAVRHWPSGMTCRFTLGQRNVIRQYANDAEAGDNVSCSTVLIVQGGTKIVLTQYATRYHATRTVKQELDAAQASFRLRDPGAQTAAGPFRAVDAGIGAAPAHETVRMEISDNGDRLFVRAAAASVGDWLVGQRVTAPISEEGTADAVGEILIAASALEVQKADVAIDRLPDPSAAPPPAAVKPKTASTQPSPRAAAAAEAQRLVAGVSDKADISDLTIDETPRIQHKPSGVICEFGADPKTNRLVVNATGAVCDSADSFGAGALQVIRTPGSTDAQARAMVSQLMTTAFAASQPMDGFNDLVSDRTDAVHTSQRFTATTKAGAQVFVRVAYSRVGDWTLVQRIIAPLEKAKTADYAGEQTFAVVIRQAVDRQAAVARTLGALPKKGG